MVRRDAVHTLQGGRDRFAAASHDQRRPTSARSAHRLWELRTACARHSGPGGPRRVGRSRHRRSVGEGMSAQSMSPTTTRACSTTRARRDLRDRRSHRGAGRDAARVLRTPAPHAAPPSSPPPAARCSSGCRWRPPEARPSARRWSPAAACVPAIGSRSRSTRGACTSSIPRPKAAIDEPRGGAVEWRGNPRPDRGFHRMPAARFHGRVQMRCTPPSPPTATRTSSSRCGPGCRTAPRGRP